MKKLMYLSISILCLSVSALIGFHLGVQKAEADWQYPSGAIVGLTQDFAFAADGSAWTINATELGVAPEHHLPVPVSEVKLLTGQGQSMVLVTTSDVTWVFSQSEGYIWINIGSLPISSVNTTPTTWGQLKNKYQEEDEVK